MPVPLSMKLLRCHLPRHAGNSLAAVIVVKGQTVFHVVSEETVGEARVCHDVICSRAAHHLGEGFHDPRLDTLFITMPISFKGKLIQYAGRLHRDYPGKKDVQIYDYVDKEVSVLWNMHQKRLKTYKNIGYFVKEG